MRRTNILLKKYPSDITSWNVSFGLEAQRQMPTLISRWAESGSEKPLKLRYKFTMVKMKAVVESFRRTESRVTSPMFPETGNENRFQGTQIHMLGEKINQVTETDGRP